MNFHETEQYEKIVYSLDIISKKAISSSVIFLYDYLLVYEKSKYNKLITFERSDELEKFLDDNSDKFITGAYYLTQLEQMRKAMDYLLQDTENQDTRIKSIVNSLRYLISQYWEDFYKLGIEPLIANFLESIES